MPFQPGKEKTGGRQTGVRNKRTNALIAMAEDRFPDLDPVLGMLQIASDELDQIRSGQVVSVQDVVDAAQSEDAAQEIQALLKKLMASKQLALDALKGAAPYLHAKLKAVDMQVDAGDAAPLLQILLKGAAAQGADAQDDSKES